MKRNAGIHMAIGKGDLCFLYPHINSLLSAQNSHLIRSDFRRIFAGPWLCDLLSGMHIPSHSVFLQDTKRAMSCFSAMGHRLSTETAAESDHIYHFMPERNTAVDAIVAYPHRKKKYSEYELIFKLVFFILCIYVTTILEQKGKSCHE